MISLSHELAVEKLAAAGWETARFAASTEAFLAEHPELDAQDGEELVDSIRVIGLRPDAWRFVIEGPDQGWGHLVLVVECAEVTVTNGLTEDKLARYTELWSCCDYSEYTALRLVEFDQFGYERIRLGDEFFIPRYHRMLEYAAQQPDEDGELV